MFKMIKLVFFLTFVLVGLYFFGDFRINEVNVKNYLQKHITTQNITSVKNQVVHFYEVIARLFQETKKMTEGQGMAQTLKTSVPSQKKATTPESLIPMDKLSKDDRKLMKDLLKQHLKSK